MTSKIHKVAVEGGQVPVCGPRSNFGNTKGSTSWENVTCGSCIRVKNMKIKNMKNKNMKTKKGEKI